MSGTGPNSDPTLAERVSSVIQRAVGVLAVTAAMAAAAPNVEPALADHASPAHAASVPHHDQPNYVHSDNESTFDGVRWGVIGALVVVLGVTLKEMIRPSDRDRED